MRDIKTTARNGQVVSIVPVNDEDEILLMTSRGKLQRISCGDINTIGRNTQGVRIMGLDDGDTLAAVVRVPRDEDDEEGNEKDTAAQQAEPGVGVGKVEAPENAGNPEKTTKSENQPKKNDEEE